MSALVSNRKQVLSMFKQLLRTGQQVFHEDLKAVQASRDKIKTEFVRNKSENDPAKIQELIKVAKESDEILRTKVIQAKEVRPNVYTGGSESQSEEDSTSASEGEEESNGFRNEHSIRLTPLQRAIITVGSGLSSFLDPTRAENIATFGEISAGLVLNRLYKNMMADTEGQRILLQKPRINSKTVNLEYLSSLPEGTLGWAYINFLRKNNVTPDSRLPVRFIEDPELAYVMQRYREVHDLVHTVTGQPTNMLGEVVVKWIEGIQTGLPMCVTGGLFGATRLRPKQRQRYVNSHLKWAIDVGFTSKPFLFIFYEERWEQSLIELQNLICPKLLTPPS